MSEKTVTASVQADAGQKSGERGSSGLGMVKGVPGTHITGIGALDLRGVPADEVHKIESLTGVGVVLTDENNRNSLSGARMEGVGSIVEIGLDYRMILGPWIEFSRASIEAMAAGQKLALVGIVIFKPDVPAALVAEKLDGLLVVGVILASAAVHGVLIGKAQITGVSVTLPETDGPVIHCIGETRMTAGYLSHLTDGTTYINIGKTRIDDDVTVELLSKKIASHLNIGVTEAQQPLLDLLNARCTSNLGQFVLPGADGDAE
jgi:hypothetical protein